MAGYELYRKGKRLYEAGKLEEAIKPLYKFLESNPRHVKAREYLMSAYASLRKKSRAIKEASKVADLSSGNPEGLVRAASVVREAGDFDKSIGMLEDALRESKRQQSDGKKEAEIREELAKSYEQRGYKHKARDELKTAEKLKNPPRYDDW